MWITYRYHNINPIPFSVLVSRRKLIYVSYYFGVKEEIVSYFIIQVGR